MKQAPLPERLRPRDLSLFVGQVHLQERLQGLADSARLPSLLLFGPPGCGKSTLALALAYAHSENVLRLSAPEAGLSQLRKQLAGVDILVLDELHRFSKAQQDFFLPIVETGELTLIGTTTENPSFSITSQLLSRLHVLRLRPLTKQDLLVLGQRGADLVDATLAPEIMEFFSSAAHGDARTMLNLVEYASSLPVAKQTMAHVMATLPEILARHDKDGDSHYEYASALIKSIRGSDPDASLYYLACLLEGGEDPRFICRRLILSASEDVGLADPAALPLAVACQQAVAFVGMPEGYIPLAETVVYLALARKSNSTYGAYALAAREVKQNGAQPVPIHLRNASTKLQREWGYGKDYKYPHAYPQGHVEQEYFPEAVRHRTYYVPKEHGDEGRLSAWSRRLQRGQVQASSYASDDGRKRGAGD